jgi:hypothetical protein
VEDKRFYRLTINDCL